LISLSSSPRRQPPPAIGGAFGWAAFREDYNEWEIISMQTPGDFWGERTQDLPRSAGGICVNEVGDVFGGYDVFQANHGNHILVANPAGGGNFASYWFAGKSGDRVLCPWNMRTGRYFIVAIEPNDADYQTLDVVTEVDFGSQTVTKKAIELAPWTTVI
jgi:hypothetical protein